MRFRYLLFVLCRVEVERVKRVFSARSASVDPGANSLQIKNTSKPKHCKFN